MYYQNICIIRVYYLYDINVLSVILMYYLYDINVLSV